MKIVAILTLGRSGSTYINSILQNISNLCVTGEIFHDIRPNGINKPCLDELLKIYDVSTLEQLSKFAYENPLDYFNNIVEIAKAKNYKYLSYKIFHSHINNIGKDKIADVLKKSDVIIIHKRKNVLEQYVSLQKAHKIDRWANVNTNNVKIEFNKDGYLNYKKKWEETFKFYEEFCKLNNIKYVKTVYEELLKIPDSNPKAKVLYFIKKLNPFLNKNEKMKFKNHKINITLFKQNTVPMIQNFSNPDEFRKFRRLKKNISR